MRIIDLETWPRRGHFEIFSTWDYPHFNMCANVDLTAVYPVIKQRGISFNLAIIYFLARTANAIPEFRYRIRAGKPIEHEVVHPSSTILGKDDIFSFCALTYFEDFLKFAEKATEKITRVQQRPRLSEEDQGRDDWLFMTAIPWVSFTSFMHPLKLYPADSVPRFAWGKFFQDGDSMKMPLSVQGHHAVMDGLHVGKFYDVIQRYLDHPELVFGNE
jgi:chloramphenicol O-acetyltransferase type A